MGIDNNVCVHAYAHACVLRVPELEKLGPLSAPSAAAVAAATLLHRDGFVRSDALSM